MLPSRFTRIAAVSTAVLLSLALIATTTPTNAAQSPPRKIFTGWIPYYSMKTALPSAVANGDLIREVMPFWYTLKSETKITDLYTPANPSVPISVPLTTMRDSGFSIIPTITDGTNKLVLAKLLADPVTRTKVVKTITTLVVTNNFDGIDLDFEGFAFSDGTASWPTTRPNWVAFVREMSTSLHKLDKILSITTPVLFDPTSGKKGYYVFDWASIAPLIDRLRIMTYDYSTSSPGPIGPLTWAELSIKYAVSVIPASKIYVGVAGYGRDWVTKVVGTCPASLANVIAPGAKAATFVMRDAANLASSYGATPTYHVAFGEVTFSYQKVYTGTTSGGLATSCTASRTAWYQDSRGYGARAQLVAKYRLGGITAWTLGMEDPTAVQAVRQVAQSIAPDLVISTLASDRTGALYGNSVKITGVLQLPDKTPVANQSVKLEIRGSGESGWREIFQVVTGVDGSFNIPIVLSKTSSLRISSDATWERLASASAEISVSISRMLAVTPPTSSAVGANFIISGVVQPREAGPVLTLEKYILGKWKLLGNPMPLEVGGKFTFAIVENEPGIARYRVKVSGDEKLLDGVSPIFAVLIY